MASFPKSSPPSTDDHKQCRNKTSSYLSLFSFVSSKRILSFLKLSSCLPCGRYVEPAEKIIVAGWRGGFALMWCLQIFWSDRYYSHHLAYEIHVSSFRPWPLKDKKDCFTRWARTGSIDRSVFQFSYCCLIERKKNVVVFKATTTTRSDISHFQILTNKLRCVYRSGNSASAVLILCSTIFLIQQWQQFRDWRQVSLEREWQSKSVCR